MTTVVWLRQDLRIADNPALWHAAKLGQVLPVYVFDEISTRELGSASRWWLHNSLAKLQEALPNLVLIKGNPEKSLQDLARQLGAEAVYWNRCYEPQAVERDKAIKSTLLEQGIEVKSFNGSLLHEPWEVLTGSQSHYKVYSPYWRAVQKLQKPQALPVTEPDLLPKPDAGVDLSDLNLLPTNPDWAEGWDEIWTPGEAGAARRLEAFIEDGLKGYGELRDRPDRNNTSRLSPHLHFGEISPRQIWTRIKFAIDREEVAQQDASKFLSEVVWREFSCQLLYHFPELPEKNWKPAFDDYPWMNDPEHLKAWQKGQTGYPLVDAGMRELWQTGTMHNRVRMVVASFLVKHLRIHWREGEAWFWDTLVDADLANNSASWQWVTGSGADAAPYFRIFNPFLQGQKFDPNGDYVRRWCPELSKLDARHIHTPFKAPKDVLKQADVVLGKTYPHPIVDHDGARKAALAGYERIKGG